MTGISIAAPWHDGVNRCDGDAAVVHLSRHGLRGNTHFALSGLKSGEVAGLTSEILTVKKPGQRPR